MIVTVRFNTCIGRKFENFSLRSRFYDSFFAEEPRTTDMPSTSFALSVKAKYVVEAKESWLKTELEALADKMTDKQFAAFTKTGVLDSKSIRPEADGRINPSGVYGYSKKDMHGLQASDIQGAKYAHVLTPASGAKTLDTGTKLTESQAKALFKKLRPGARNLNQFDLMWRHLNQNQSQGDWLGLLLQGSPEEQAKDLMKLGFGIVEKGWHKSHAVFLSAKAYKLEASYKLELPKNKKADRVLTSEEKELLEKWAPDLGDDTAYRRAMTLADLKKNADRMSDDDIAWQLLNSKGALDIGDEKCVRSRMGFREICLLQLMNKNITKKARTSIADYMLDKAGVSFVGGPKLKQYIKALAKTGALDSRIIEGVEGDSIQGDIYYGRITDPDELRKISIKDYGYQLAHNEHTPSDVLEKIVEYDKKAHRGGEWEQGPEVQWSGMNPNMGGKAGKDFYFSFSDALRHPNYPLDKLLKVYEACKARYKDPKAAQGMASTLWNRPDLPKAQGLQLVKDRRLYTKPGEMPMEPPACLDGQDFMDYWNESKKTKDKSGWTTDTGVALHPHVPSEVLKELLDKSESERTRQEVYKKLRERGDLQDKDVVSKVKKTLKFEGPDDLLKLFGAKAYAGEKAKEKLKFTPVPEAELKDLEKEMRAASTHDDFTFDVVGAYRVDRPIHKDYPEAAKGMGNVKHGLYHGTSLANAAGILASGFNMKAESRTGQMFGAGTYLASSASKAAQYASDNFSKSGLGIVFKMDAALGKTAEWKYGRPEHDEYYRAVDQEAFQKHAKKTGVDPDDVAGWHMTHDSVHAKKGLALEHDEMVVKNPSQINITEIIVVRKEEK
jgi:hypothetical protein